VLWRRIILPGLLLLAFRVPAVHAQTFQAVLTEGGQSGKNFPIVGLGIFNLDKIAPALPYSIQFRSDMFFGQHVAVYAGSIKKPGPAIFVLPGLASQSPVEGSFTPSLLIPAPDYGINTWEDAIAAMWTGKTFLRMDTPHDADNVCGKITVVRR
jgi:hypothetical protein